MARPIPWQAGWWLLLLGLLASGVVRGEPPAVAPLPGTVSGDVALAAQQPGSLTALQPGSRPSPAPRVPVFTVAWMATCMALASSLGVLPFFFVGKLSPPCAGLANAVACGVMISASYGLLQEGSTENPVYLIGGMLLGAAFVSISEATLEQYEVESFEELAGAEARKVILFLAVMAAHALGEGSGVGVSFAGQRGWAQGTLVTLAIGLHNVPEGLAVATVMAAKGASPRRALLWATLTAAPQAVVAVPAYLFVDQFKALLPLALGFAAGCMIWIVFAELLPDALEALPSQQVASAVTCAAAGLQALSLYIARLEQPDGHLASPFRGMAPPQLPGGTGKLLLLAPLAMLAAAGGAVAVAHLLPSRPVQLGLTTGLLVATGALQWLAALSGATPVAWGARLLLPLLGAAAALCAYAAYPTVSRSSKSGGQQSAAAAAAAAALYRSGLPPDSHWHANGGGTLGNGLAHTQQQQQQQQQDQFANGCHPNGYGDQEQQAAVNGYHTAGHAGNGYIPGAAEAPAAAAAGHMHWAPGVTAHLRLNAGGHKQGREVEVLSAGLSPRKLLARSVSGGPQGGSGGAPPHKAAAGGEGDDALLPLTLMPGDLVPARATGRRGMQQLVAVSLLGPLLQGAAHGLLLARGLALVGQLAAAAFPAAVTGLLGSLTAVGLLSQLLAARRHLALYCSSLAAVPALVAATGLLAGSATTPAWLAWAGRLQLLAAGYSICCGALFCWPAAREWHKDKAAAGVAVGGLVALAAQGLLRVGCAWWGACLVPP